MRGCLTGEQVHCRRTARSLPPARCSAFHLGLRQTVLCCRNVWRRSGHVFERAIDYETVTSVTTMSPLAARLRPTRAAERSVARNCTVGQPVRLDAPALTTALLSGIGGDRCAYQRLTPYGSECNRLDDGSDACRHNRPFDTVTAYSMSGHVSSRTGQRASRSPRSFSGTTYNRNAPGRISLVSISDVADHVLAALTAARACQRSSRVWPIATCVTVTLPRL